MAAAIAIAILVAAVFFLRRQADELDVDAVTDTTPEEELLQLCLGDQSQAERLVALESKRTPTLSRSEAIARAVDSLRRAR